MGAAFRMGAAVRCVQEFINKLTMNTGSVYIDIGFPKMVIRT